MNSKELEDQYIKLYPNNDVTIEEIMNYFIDVQPSIPENYSIVLNNLKEAEGGLLHRNLKESDITNSYGIYKYKHPNAIVFGYIDKVAKEITNEKSNRWDDDLIKEIDNMLNKSMERYFSYLFYKEYLEDLHIDLFHPFNVITMVNLYANSPLGTWLSIQEGIWDMYRYGLLKTDKRDISSVDGKYGLKTKNCLLEIKNNEDIKYQIIFNQSILLAMKGYYSDLINRNPDKYLTYIKGWDNRIENIQYTSSKYKNI
jgi:hypothetical protein